MKALAVHRWPGPTPVPQDGLFAILISTVAPTAPDAGTYRDAARRQLRQAACEALAAVLCIPADDISIVSRPGQPPSILLGGHASTMGISLSHDGDYSLAAINLQGPVGADILRVQDIPDWQAVARDYLGAALTEALLALSASERPQAFSQAWANREAQLKLEGRHLAEWTASTTASEVRSLILPTGIVGALAT
jgi:4'-phosphopantetheinyl transferase